MKYVDLDSSYIRQKRNNMGLSLKEFALLLDMKENGERTVRGWESGEHVPTKAKWEQIIALPDKAPFREPADQKHKFTFIDLFAGIGGIRLPFQRLKGKCVFSSEWDKFAQKTYAANFGELPSGDITQIRAADIPDHDILLGGFPCQAFSQAGKRQGFQDTRGTMFFEIQRILVEKRPKAFLLENVKQLQGHDKGRTLKTILEILRGEFDQELDHEVTLSDETKKALSEKLNYWVDVKVLRAADFGVPQNRERIFLVGFDKNYFGEECNFDELFNWPVPPKTQTRLGDILEDVSKFKKSEDVYTISDRLWEGHQRRKEGHGIKGNGFGYTLYTGDSQYTNTLSARYYKDGSEILISQAEQDKNPRKLTPRECARLQGFPENYIVDAVSHGQIYKQFGNSVCVKVIEAVAVQMVSCLDKAEKIVAEKQLKLF
ncbi:DNA (cytosine-5-)-methyltransferase [Acinetobacter vivianii]|uniref:DNA (cytosine-5-)-methyltransferase n=1 Tax=Acinetobacter vivianii TaxID=1776742 RepID=UPI002DB9D485|nr:DNA (cytosine-5-)-methyltransferase [Acinetobacter vivianii]MEB6666334.1 DNA (cytosine-5-)-methyltransferase [Acinetobacter vivianii]